MIIDGDGHFLEPAHLWTDYVEPEFASRVKVERDAAGHLVRVLADDWGLIDYTSHRNMNDRWGPGNFFMPGGLKPGRPQKAPFEMADPGGSDGAARLAVQDANGIDAAVIFPTYGMFAPLVPDRDLGAALCRVVNEWSADYASVAPDELYIIAALPWQEPQRAAVELRRCVEQHGFVSGFVAPYPASDGRTLADPGFDVLWETAVELDVPICVHTGLRSDLEQLASSRGGFIARHAAVHPMEGMSAFALLYEGGVFERFPMLRFGFMESTCGWAVFWTERLHEHWEQVGWQLDPPITRSPEEVFREQCIVGCEGEEHMVPYVQGYFGEDKVVWASDFPHFDTEPPFTADMLERTDMTRSQKEGVMARAAIEFYKLDPDRIRKSRERRGVAPETVIA